MRKLNKDRIEKLSRPKTAINYSLKTNQVYIEEQKTKDFQQQELQRVVDEDGQIPLIFQKNPVFLTFENQLQAELYNSRCSDTGEVKIKKQKNKNKQINKQIKHISLDKAKIFKDEFNKINNRKHNNILNLYSMRLGVTSMQTLSNLLKEDKYKYIDTLNLADNPISDNGMHLIKQIMENTQIKHLNLASNMISESGFEIIVDELSKNQNLKSLDLGILEGSIRKNSFGIDGAKCIAALILQNKNIEIIKLYDNDIGVQGGDIIGTALKQNKNLKNLTISENYLKSQGAEFILKSALFLESLDLGKNCIKSNAGISIRNYLQNNQNLKRLNLEFNELSFEGIKEFRQGLLYSQSLQYINLKGNGIGDEGFLMICEVLNDNYILEELDVSLNEISSAGIKCFADILPFCGLKNINLSKNFLGDESLFIIGDICQQYENVIKLQKIDFSSSRVADAGILYFLDRIDYFENMRCIKCQDNFISEKVEKVLLEILIKNKTLIEFGINGNRLSLSFLNKVKKILQRNIIELEEKEPNKIKTQIYKLKYEQKQIVAERKRLEAQEKQINDLESLLEQKKKKLQFIIKTEAEKRKEILNKIQDQQVQILRKKAKMDEKNNIFENKKKALLEELQKLQQEYSIEVTEKNRIVNDLGNLDIQIIQMEEEYKKECNEIENQIQLQKQKREEINQKTILLNLEYSIFYKQEKELTEQVHQQIEKNKILKKNLSQKSNKNLNNIKI
ncbi:hypothetical protein IMG5_107210 [Ichthyophthirius multifiliis]|uniref:Uncharacterized protein n=1 Tax=Ichthyophthirius multifiliis TaxID=5932 RepID=G0QTC6_ICHMU|nr:hypothetical protein IMG5_107210 [Ichthyophthirius multifiliis]EGR31503.1 hypothetical protein IMG5_107210 [Ichthyophthirius multifiliis]|eukprot:XP_004034989.1 hypothetical protein IMG5_107210 [Ichthyophthirius multifiliis]